MAAASTDRRNTCVKSFCRRFKPHVFRGRSLIETMSMICPWAPPFWVARVGSWLFDQEPKPVFAMLTPQMSREEQVQNLIAALEKSGFTIKPSKQNGEADRMASDPIIPMSPDELPQQRIHEVVSLPERPKPFDCHVGYGGVPEDIIPKQAARTSIYLCQVEWAWSPMHNRLDAYYLHRGRSHWLLWTRYWDDNWGKWEWIVAACVPKKDVTGRSSQWEMTTNSFIHGGRQRHSTF